MQSDRYVEPSRGAGRVLGAAILVVGGVMVFAWTWLYVFLGAKGASQEALEAKLQTLEIASSVLGGFAALIAAFGALYTGRIGFRTLLHGQYPPHGTTVITRVKIRVGQEARIWGWLSVALGLMFSVAAMQIIYVTFVT